MCRQMTEHILALLGCQTLPLPIVIELTHTWVFFEDLIGKSGRMEIISDGLDTIPGLSISSDSISSSASRTSIQSDEASLMGMFLASLKSPLQGWCKTRAPKPFATSTVLSEEPVSTTIISSSPPIPSPARGEEIVRQIKLPLHPVGGGRGLGE